MPMKDFTHLLPSKSQMNVEGSVEKDGLQSPSKQSLKNILAYSKALEARPSKLMKNMLIHLN